MIIGYARVSTDGQSLDGQLDLLRQAGAEKIFAEKLSGKSRARPELARLLEHLRPGDLVVVTRFDRAARRLIDLVDLVEDIAAKGASFRSLSEDIDTSSTSGRLVLHVMAAIAQFERDRIVERTKEGQAAARARGRFPGRPRALSPEQRDTCLQLLGEGKSVREVARLFKVSRSTVARVQSELDQRI